MIAVWGTKILQTSSDSQVLKYCCKRPYCRHSFPTLDGMKSAIGVKDIRQKSRLAALLNWRELFEFSSVRGKMDRWQVSNHHTLMLRSSCHLRDEIEVFNGQMQGWPGVSSYCSLYASGWTGEDHLVLYSLSLSLSLSLSHPPYFKGYFEYKVYRGSEKEREKDLRK